jgi:hypothetical protein
MTCGTAIALRQVSAPLAPFGLRADLVMIDQALGALEHGHVVDRDLDAAIYEALGWRVERMPISRRRISWRTRSPVSTAWLGLPSPTSDVTDAASLVPHGWDWGAGVTDAQPRAWCRERRIRPGRDLPRFSECNRLTVARALAAAALFAHRQIAMEGAHG